MTDRSARGRLRPRSCVLLVGALALVFTLAPALGTAQEEPVVERILRTLTLLPENDLPALVMVTRALETAPELRQALLEGPRGFLAAQTVSQAIDLAPSAFQITAIDFSIAPEDPDEPWFGVAEPLDGLVFEPKGLGIFYRNVGILVQEAYEPLRGEESGTMRASDGAPELQIADMLALLARLSAEAMERLRDAMKELDRLPPDAPERINFIRNPREYLLGRELTLPASTYRLVALDFHRAEPVGAVKSDAIRAGLAVIPEGIGVFGTEVGVFLQLAI
ncbi:MAG: hypothetical protein AB1778_04805 [Candidatus Bipolaricaulota bacterium]